MNGRLLLGVTLIGLLLLCLAGPVAAGPNPEEPEAPALERVLVPGRVALAEMESAGFDINHDVTRVPLGLEVGMVLREADVARLADFGARILAPEEQFSWTEANARGRLGVASFALAGGLAPLTAGAAAADEPGPLDTTTIGRVDYFTSKGQGFISVEAKTTQMDSVPAMLLLWDAGAGTPAGAGGATVMQAFVDSGEYMYHRVVTTVTARPETVMVVSALGSTATAFTSDWLYPVDPLVDNEGYQSRFIDGYRDPTQLYERFEAMAAEHPDVAEIVPLAHLTNGYQRKAQATIGSAQSAVVVSSVAWGHEGGNDLTVEFVTSADAPRPLRATVNGNAITVTIDATSTAAEVIAALNADAGDLVVAHPLGSNTGSGIVTATGPVALDDFLDAPDSVERGPFQPRALHIGRHRDGTRTGVLIIAQDHAREWVTSLVALEAAERLLANYETDPETAAILENVEIWIVPANNPDGHHYSMHDFNMQRRNMTNHCGEAASDPARRDAWGVDLNRNYSIASIFDGYDGASLSCTSDTFAGPAELSEPESQNIVDLVEANPNIKFFMTIHSNGGQLFWQPGAYIAEGRVTTPRPELRDEAYYWEMAERILSHVWDHRETPVRPDMVGGSSDVLYSSAGNVREELYFNYGVYAFGWEIGGSTWDTTTRTWVAGEFQPAWDEAAEEYMEYANGVIEMFRIAADWGNDQTPPTTTLEQTPREDGGVDVRFSFSEPVRIYYTTDGSAPTVGSSRYGNAGLREGPEVLTVTDPTTFRWFATDTAGNIEAEQSASVG